MRIDWDDEEFGSGAVLPAQWRSPREPCACGCHRLMLRVLDDAFFTLVRALNRRGDYEKALWEVMGWFERPDMDATVNLSNCCAALNLDVGCVQAVAQRLLRAPVKTSPASRSAARLHSLSDAPDPAQRRPGAAGRAILRVKLGAPPDCNPPASVVRRNPGHAPLVPARYGGQMGGIGQPVVDPASELHPNPSAPVPIAADNDISRAAR